MGLTRILAYGCSTAAGRTVDQFWRSLSEGEDCSRTVDLVWPRTIALRDSTIGHVAATVCAWPDSPGESACDILVRHLAYAWGDCRKTLSGSLGRLGVIFASTKGCIDDCVWDEEPDLSQDTIRPVLDQFLRVSGLRSDDSICVSNACTSSVTALWLANEWLRQDRVDHVLVLAADRIGPFVYKGFETLKVLTPTICRPFSGARDGLRLGEAAAAILLGRSSDQESGEREDSSSNSVGLLGVGLDTEGFAVTRPAHSGESLKKVFRSFSPVKPDLIIAHGTGTLVNDQIEDQVFSSLYGERAVPVTATKWCVGHTLGVSAALDVIAACRILQGSQPFWIGNTPEIDSRFSSSYLSAGTDKNSLRPRRIFVSSLGFGGVHAGVLLERVGQADGRESVK